MGFFHDSDLASPLYVMVVWGSRLITGIYWNTKQKILPVSVIITRTKFSFQICLCLSLRQFSTVFLFSSLRSPDVEQRRVIIFRNTGKKPIVFQLWCKLSRKQFTQSCTELKFFIIYEEDPSHFQLGQSLYLNIHWHISPWEDLKVHWLFQTAV